MAKAVVVQHRNAALLSPSPITGRGLGEEDHPARVVDHFAAFACALAAGLRDVLRGVTGWPGCDLPMTPASSIEARLTSAGRRSRTRHGFTLTRQCPLSLPRQRA